jgi:hypothetical protein
MIANVGSRSEDVFRACMPWEDGSLAMLRAYVDAGTQDGIMAIAVVGFGLDRAAKAEREWRQAFDGRVVRMANVHNRMGAFAGISHAEADRICRRAVDIANAHASHIAVVSCDVAEVRALAVKGANADRESVRLLDGFMNPYPAGLHWSMAAAGALVGEQRSRIAYWIEKGDDFQGQSRAYLDYIDAAPHGEVIKSLYQMGATVFTEKDDVRLFDVADMVAWEWSRHVRRVRAEEPSRKSLVALMGTSGVVNGHPYVSTERRYGAHYSGGQVERFFRRMDALLNASSVAEVLELSRQIDREDVGPMAGG